tara:strand:+ start:367 stop:885 length:519 start_codon:yes stop_codon:yes gene_type:complete
VGRPKKSDKTPRSANAGTTDSRAIATDLRADRKEAERRRRETAKAARKQSPWIAAHHASRRDKRPLGKRAIADLAKQVAADGVSLADAAQLLFLTFATVENAQHAGEITTADYATKARQLVKLTTEVAAAYRDQGDPLPDQITVTLESKTETVPESPFDQADGETGDVLVVH